MLPYKKLKSMFLIFYILTLFNTNVICRWQLRKLFEIWSTQTYFNTNIDLSHVVIPQFIGYENYKDTLGQEEQDYVGDCWIFLKKINYFMKMSLSLKRYPNLSMRFLQYVLSTIQNEIMKIYCRYQSLRNQIQSAPVLKKFELQCEAILIKYFEMQKQLQHFPLVQNAQIQMPFNIEDVVKDPNLFSFVQETINQINTMTQKVYLLIKFYRAHLICLKTSIQRLIPQPQSDLMVQQLSILSQRLPSQQQQQELSKLIESTQSSVFLRLKMICRWFKQQSLYYYTFRMQYRSKLFQLKHLTMNYLEQTNHLQNNIAITLKQKMDEIIKCFRQNVQLVTYLLKFDMQYNIETNIDERDDENPGPSNSQNGYQSSYHSQDNVQQPQPDKNSNRRRRYAGDTSETYKRQRRNSQQQLRPRKPFLRLRHSFDNSKSSAVAVVKPESVSVSSRIIKRPIYRKNSPQFGQTAGKKLNVRTQSTILQLNTRTQQGVGVPSNSGKKSSIEVPSSFRTQSIAGTSSTGLQNIRQSSSSSVEQAPTTSTADQQRPSRCSPHSPPNSASLNGRSPSSYSPPSRRIRLSSERNSLITMFQNMHISNSQSRRRSNN